MKNSYFERWELCLRNGV